MLLQGGWLLVTNRIEPGAGSGLQLRAGSAAGLTDDGVSGLEYRLRGVGCVEITSFNSFRSLRFGYSGMIVTRITSLTSG